MVFLFSVKDVFSVSSLKAAVVHNQFGFCIIRITVSDYADANPTYETDFSD